MLALIGRSITLQILADLRNVSAEKYIKHACHFALHLNVITAPVHTIVAYHLVQLWCQWFQTL